MKDYTVQFRIKSEKTLPGYKASESTKAKNAIEATEHINRRYSNYEQIIEINRVIQQ